MLALVQARLVQKLLAEAHGVPLETIEIRTITTSGDRLTDAPLSEAGGKGLFSREIEAALDAGGTTMMVVPTELVGEVRALIARKQRNA